MKHPISFKKINKDVSPNLTQPGDYYEAVNGRIIMNDSQTAFAFSNEKGTSIIEYLPSVQVNTGSSRFDVYDEESNLIYSVSYTLTSELSVLPNTTSAHKIIATCELKGRFFVISQESTYYLIWEWDENNTRLQLLYYNDFGASQYEHIRIQTRYENENTQKIYFLDSNSLWHFNVKDGTDTIDTPINQVRAFPDTSDGTVNHLINPELVAMLPGGNFTAGKVQYAYNLYSDSGAETKISPFSQMFNVSDSFNGLDDSEDSSSAFKITIENIPENFGLINIYRIFYGSAVATPEVKLIIQDELQDTTYTFIDDNNLDASDSSLEKILFLGSDPFTAQDMAVKDNVLFPVNIEYSEYDPEFDARAYAWNSSSQALIQDANLGNQTLTATSDSVAATHDAINPSVSAEVGDANYNVYRYQFDGTTLGVEGPNVAIRFVSNTRSPYNINSTSIVPNENSYANNFEISNAWGNMSFKRDEVYRFFIRFTNSKGQKSFAKWIADVRIPNYNTYTIAESNAADQLEVQDVGIRVDVSNLPSDAVSWEILREERTEADKTIKAQGFVNNTLLVTTGTDRDYVDNLVPNPFVRCYHDDSNIDTVNDEFDDGLGYSFANGRTSRSAATTAGDITGFTVPEILDTNTDSYQLIDYTLEFYSPEILQKRYQFNVSSTDYVNFIGGLSLTDKLAFKGNANANTVAGSSPSTAFDELTVGQNANSLADVRAFIKWDSGEGMTFAPAETATTAPSGTYYINSYIAAFFTHDVNTIVKKDITGTSKFIPKLSERGERVVSWDSGSNNTSSLMNNCEMTMKDNGSTPAVYYYGSHVNDRLAFNIDNYNPGTGGIGSVLTNAGADVDYVMTRTANPKLVIVDYKGVVQNQYGGNTYEARQLNNPVVISDNIPVGTTQRVIYGGDTYVCVWNFMRQQCVQGYHRRRTQRENIIIPIETSINLDLRHDEEFYTNLGKYQTTLDDYQLPEKVYSRDVSYPISSVKPLSYQTNNKFDNRVLASDVKINGELKDAWLSFRENNYIDLDGVHGGITGIVEDRDQLFTFQPEAISQLLINPRVQSVDPVGIQLGKGDLLYDYNYLTTSSGSINKMSLTKTPYGIMYYDAVNNKLSILNRGENPISDIKGMNTFFRNDLVKSFVSADTPNAGKGVQGYYDHETKETYMSFIQGETSKTLVYSHLLDGFHFIHDFQIHNPINIRGRVFWINSDLDEIHEHKIGDRGFYFGEYRNSSITFISNPSYINSVFDTITFNAHTKDSSGNDDFDNTIDRLRVYNEHQDTGFVSLTYGGNLKRKFREWRVNIPRESTTRNRIMSPYAYITMQWTNAQNTSKVIKDINVNFRPKTVDFI